jgi:phosphoserine phosphatase RsbU/P
MSSDAVLMEISSEWTAACEVQQRFMGCLGPRRIASMAGTVDVSARCRQVRELGGDFYDLVPFSDRRLALAVGDASGKGLAAALMISNVQSSLRTAALFTGNNGAKAIEAVNRQVYGSSLAERYATLFYGVFDGQTRILRYVNAGHHPPMVIRRDGSVTWLESGGAPVGMFPDGNYEEGSMQLDPGDMVLACTDGVIEAADLAGEEWGVEGLRRAASDGGTKSADQIVHTIFSSMDEFSRGRQTDDATVVVLRLPAKGSEIEVGTPQRLFHSPKPGIGVNFDVSSDGKRLLVNHAEGGGHGPF